MGILDKFKLDGKVAMVSGCKHGLGRAMTLALAEAGADIIGVSLTLEKSGSEIEKEVVSRKRKFKSYRCDF
ncbi:MAG: 2-deoxy-D-gluconate 3-dehydrogenase, partial [Chloroflexi bacterium]|nr:2-deoxy-D-gluconate 3-dehydrogenase [Chloroflexota bacterium]